MIILFDNEWMSSYFPVEATGEGREYRPIPKSEAVALAEDFASNYFDKHGDRIPADRFLWFVAGKVPMLLTSITKKRLKEGLKDGLYAVTLNPCLEEERVIVVKERKQQGGK